MNEGNPLPTKWLAFVDGRPIYPGKEYPFSFSQKQIRVLTRKAKLTIVWKQNDHFYEAAALFGVRCEVKFAQAKANPKASRRERRFSLGRLHDPWIHSFIGYLGEASRQNSGCYSRSDCFWKEGGRRPKTDPCGFFCVPLCTPRTETGSCVLRIKFDILCP